MLQFDRVCARFWNIIYLFIQLVVIGDRLNARRKIKKGWMSFKMRRI